MIQDYMDCADFLKSKTKVRPKFAIILGSGLGGLVNEIEIHDSLEYKDIPNFPISTVLGHPGRLIFGKLGGKEVVAMQGRFHYYEGYSMQEVVFPVRVFKYLGVETLLVSNAAGGMNPEFEIGDLMLVKDHINLQPEHPLRGKNDEKLGPRFPDMSEVYEPKLLQSAEEIALDLGFKIQKGVYCSVQGPTFETPAEYKYLRIIGGDAVGMSTVPEIIAARHCGLKCFCISVITDIGVEGKIVEISHQDVIEAATKAEVKMTTILKELIVRS